MFYPTFKSHIAVNACFSWVGSSEFCVTIPLKRVRVKRFPCDFTFVYVNSNHYNDRIALSVLIKCQLEMLKQFDKHGENK